MMEETRFNGQKENAPEQDIAALTRQAVLDNAEQTRQMRRIADSLDMLMRSAIMIDHSVSKLETYAAEQAWQTKRIADSLEALEAYAFQNHAEADKG